MRVVRWAVIALACLIASGVAAQQAEFPISDGGLPVATLDSDRLLTQSQFGQALSQLIDTERLAQSRENQDLLEQMEAEERDLTEQRKSLTPEEFEPLATAFDDKVVRLRRQQDAKLNRIGEIVEAARFAFEQAATPLIRDEMRSRGIVYLINPNAIILSVGGLDLTEALIARMDQLFDDGDLALPDLP